MNNIGKANYGLDYLNGCKDSLARMDNAGNGDGKITPDEALQDLDIGFLLSGQNISDTAKILNASKDICDVLSQYAGDDGEFSAEEWADFINGDEWGSVLDAWHSSEKMAKLEMGWIDNSHIKDGAATKGEAKVGILNNLVANGFDIPTKGITAIIDEYAGEDGTFSVEEYQNLKNDPLYKDFVEKYNVTPWFSVGD